MISIIVAMTKNRVIGHQGKIPWHISEDFKHFKKTTLNQVVIMGETTFKSIKSPLPNRHNIILSRNPSLNIDGAQVAHSPEEALSLAKTYDKEIFIIGGAQIYNLFMPLADRLIISWVKKDYKGDTYFPEFNQDEWQMTEKVVYDDFEVIIYKKATTKN